MWLLSWASNPNLFGWKTHMRTRLHISAHCKRILLIFQRKTVVNRVCFDCLKSSPCVEKEALWDIFLSCRKPWNDSYCLTSIQEQQHFSGMDSPLRNSGLAEPNLYSQVTPNCFLLHWPEPQERNKSYIPKLSKLPCCLLHTKHLYHEKTWVTDK